MVPTQAPPQADDEVADFARLYNVEQWMQPGSMVPVQLAKLKEETRCPICYGKIRNARVSMVCLHRYCAACIEQYLRSKVDGRAQEGKECPVCRAHLHSRRATRPDPEYDRLLCGLYGDVAKFDEEEEKLIAASNTSHIQEWQVHLKELKEKAEQARILASLAPIRPAVRAAAAGRHYLDAFGEGEGSGGSPMSTGSDGIMMAARAAAAAGVGGGGAAAFTGRRSSGPSLLGGKRDREDAAAVAVAAPAAAADTGYDSGYDSMWPGRKVPRVEAWESTGLRSSLSSGRLHHQAELLPQQQLLRDGSSIGSRAAARTTTPGLTAAGSAGGTGAGPSMVRPGLLPLAALSGQGQIKPGTYQIGGGFGLGGSMQLQRVAGEARTGPLSSSSRGGSSSAAAAAAAGGGGGSARLLHVPASMPPLAAKQGSLPGSSSGLAASAERGPRPLAASAGGGGASGSGLARGSGGYPARTSSGDRMARTSSGDMGVQLLGVQQPVRRRSQSQPPSPAGGAAWAVRRALPPREEARMLLAASISAAANSQTAKSCLVRVQPAAPEAAEAPQPAPKQQERKQKQGAKQEQQQQQQQPEEGQEKAQQAAEAALPGQEVEQGARKPTAAEAAAPTADGDAAGSGADQAAPGAAGKAEDGAGPAAAEGAAAAAAAVPAEPLPPPPPALPVEQPYLLCSPQVLVRSVRHVVVQQLVQQDMLPRGAVGLWLREAGSVDRLEDGVAVEQLLEGRKGKQALLPELVLEYGFGTAAL